MLRRVHTRFPRHALHRGAAASTTQQRCMTTIVPANVHGSTPHPLLCLVGAATALAVAAFVPADAKNASTATPRDSARAVNAEELYNSAAYDRRKLLTFLERASADAPQDVGLLWRLARAYYDVASLPSTPADEKKSLTYRARDTIETALALDETHFAVHKAGIILSSVGEFEGSKATIANSYAVRDHWLRAIELNPADATSHHLLGRWSLTIADISWIERQLAAAIFGTPPKATYNDALAYFLAADEISPGFWKKNTFMIAQTYSKLHDVPQAQTWVLKALAIPSVTDEDNQVHQEADALRAKLKC
ncbi:Aste57867_19780 [Aphanomyces stellatus]|uniref:Regulator of microtubule dynamics protein 1 n=1 Tax=Aphanomyces stellatus TaxID=120398 RepID=A0A485LEK1_9STRA|nr:hypothetical protein As57867_019715 [Aphanomyces stellatus]VFT96478.1 Aste57867_19780 [Aphanomyces stellatus]